MKIERRNAYFCKNCRKVIITVDVDDGVTPAFIECIYCKKEFAGSFMYQLPGCLHFQIEADLEWYKPDKKEYNKLSKGEKDHVDKGGLLYRKRTNKKPIYR